MQSNSLDYFFMGLFKMEYYDLSLNDLNLIRHLRKVGRLFIRFTYNKNFQEKVEIGRLVGKDYGCGAS
jgi:hypothetical protein